MKDEITDPKQTELISEEIDKLVLEEYPYPIAVNYRRMLEANSWERKTRDCIKTFEYCIRTITLEALTQYLIRDLETFSDPELNRILFKKKLSEVTLGDWENYLFQILKAYGGKRELFFMEELYDLYWDISRIPHQSRHGIKKPFDRLVEIRNDMAHRTEPKDERGWEKLGGEALDHIRKIMKHFSFLQNYDLIRIVQPVGGGYEYECYTGQGITHNQKKLESDKEKIHSGWFYFLRQNQTLLGLHPLLIFWTSSSEENFIGDAEPEEQDVAVFDQLMKHVAQYVATVIREVIKESDAALVSEVRSLIYYNLEHVKMSRQRVKLSWVSIWDKAHQFSFEEMEGVKKKYNQALYLQRDTVYQKFQDFLSSDKTCFVLTGKSGVGKSNFVLSLAEVLAPNKDVAVLMYNAARLDVSSIDVAQKISQDLGKLIQLQGESLVNLFTELDKSEDMASKQLLVIFDAINENTYPREVLRKIDQLVGNERYPWLKVLITSRPEGWRTMKRGLPLAEERYYKEKGSEEVSVELEEFTIKLDIFERGELQSVYEKYCHFFHLQTDYAALKPAVRNALRDPLILRLVADIYSGGSIPDHIQVNDIYGLYVDSLIKTGRLHRQDVSLLEQELMPFMLSPGFYENRLTASQIQPARTKDGRPLWELVHNADSLGGGQRVNDAYIRLRDAELLDESGEGMDYVIGFKYERFYEFFGGRRLYYAAREYSREHDRNSRS